MLDDGDGGELSVANDVADDAGGAATGTRKNKAPQVGAMLLMKRICNLPAAYPCACYGWFARPLSRPLMRCV